MERPASCLSVTESGATVRQIVRNFDESDCSACGDEVVRCALAELIERGKDRWCGQSRKVWVHPSR
jgi:hypothetical protein